MKTKILIRFNKLNLIYNFFYKKVLRSDTIMETNNPMKIVEELRSNIQKITQNSRKLTKKH